MHYFSVILNHPSCKHPSNKDLHHAAVYVLEVPPLQMRFRSQWLWSITTCMSILLVAGSGMPACVSLLSLPALISIVRLVFRLRSSSDELRPPTVSREQFTLEETASDEFTIEEDAPRTGASTLTPTRRMLLGFLGGHACVIIGTLPMLFYRPVIHLPKSAVVSLGCAAFAPVCWCWASTQLPPKRVPEERKTLTTNTGVDDSEEI